MTRIRAIQTRYRGYHFRSRLEARWAIFFDAAGLEWQYEPEGFEVPTLTKEPDGYELTPTGSTTYYLPDFYLPSLDAWFEVKGAKPDDDAPDMLKWRDFTHALPEGQRAVLAYGPHPHPDELDIGGHPEGKNFDLVVPFDHHYAWCVCPWCGKPGIEFDARGARVCGYKRHYHDENAALAAIAHLGHWRADDKCYTGNDRVIKAAYAAARAARFEFGESGAS